MDKCMLGIIVLTIIDHITSPLSHSAVGHSDVLSPREMSWENKSVGETFTKEPPTHVAIALDFRL